MHEDLLGYLLGALDPEEQSRIAAELARSPQLRLELERLRHCLEPLEAVPEALDVDPPASLAERTCDAVFSRAVRGRPTPRSLPPVHTNAGMRLQHYSVADCIVLSLVVLVAFTLILPALANSRYQARKAACQDHLRVLGEGLFSYSARDPFQRFPLVPLSGSRSFAGVFAPILFEYELIGPQGAQVTCPGSELAMQDDNGWSIPTLREIDLAEKSLVQGLQDRAGGSYAYCVGYIQDGRAHAVKNLNRSHFALLSDAPSNFLPGRRSANHAGRGQNVYYEDGHYAFVTDLRFVSGTDDPWLNRAGLPEAGVDQDDAVVLPSGMHPVADPEALPVITPRLRVPVGSRAASDWTTPLLCCRRWACPSSYRTSFSILPRFLRGRKALAGLVPEADGVDGMYGMYGMNGIQSRTARCGSEPQRGDDNTARDKRLLRSIIRTVSHGVTETRKRHEREIGTAIVDGAVHLHQDLSLGLLETVYEVTLASYG